MQCDYLKDDLGNVPHGRGRHGGPRGDACEIIGEKIQPDCLVLIETTVAPGHHRVRGLPDHARRRSRARGIDDRAAAGPQLRAGHARPRTTSPRIRDFWRVCSGLQRRGPRARGEVPPRGAQHREVPAHGAGPAHRVGDHARSSRTPTGRRSWPS
ncbi:MAG: hypothetical protein MZV70_17165 [Desulfobacterales bacterium]|nr:hypothetical protein [Desulfobacterales bacterium]